MNERLVQGLKLGVNLSLVVAEKLVETVVEKATAADRGQDLAWLTAFRAGPPESGLITGAGGAERGCDGAAADGSMLSAAAAACAA